MMRVVLWLLLVLAVWALPRIAANYAVGLEADDLARAKAVMERDGYSAVEIRGSDCQVATAVDYDGDRVTTWVCKRHYRTGPMGPDEL